MVTRIGIVLTQKLGYTGSGTFTLNLAFGLRECGNEVRILAANNFDDPLLQAGFDVHYVPFDNEVVPMFPIPGMSDVMPYRSTIFANMYEAQVAAYLEYWAHHLRRFADKSIDVLHVNHWWLVAAQAIAIDIVPVAVTLHGTDLEQWRKCPHLVLSSGLHNIMPNAFHTVSDAVKCQAQKVGVLKANEAVFVPPPVREDLFYHQKKASDPLYLGSIFVGKLSERKGLVELLEAFSLIHLSFPEATLRIVGAAPGKSRWHDLAQRLGIDGRVTFTGFLAQEVLALEYRHSQVFVMPSWNEGYCLVAVEAAMCGCRIVMPQYGGADTVLRSTLPNENLFFFQKLAGNSQRHRRDYVSNLAIAWSSAIQATMEKGPLDQVDSSAFPTRRRIAELMVERVYSRANDSYNHRHRHCSPKVVD